MSWRSLGICILTVTLAACSTKSAPQPSGTVGTAAPATVPAITTVVTATTDAPSTTTPAPTTSDLGPGPSDAEIQAILDDTNAKTARVFAAFKETLVITPAIDRQIVEAFGPVAQDIRDTLLEHGAVNGRQIREHPKPPKSVVREVVTRSDNCFIVLVDDDSSPMIDSGPEQRNDLFRFANSTWYPYGSIADDQIDFLRNQRCNVS